MPAVVDHGKFNGPAATAAAPAAASNQPAMSEAAKSLVLKLQSWIYQRHIKPHPFFLDFDRLRSYKIPASQFVRGLTLMMHGSGHNQQLSSSDHELLCREFAAGAGAGDSKGADPKVNWKAFCDALDSVFAPMTVGMDPRAEVTNIKAVLHAHKHATLKQMKTQSLAATDLISNIASLPGQDAKSAAAVAAATADGDDDTPAPGTLSPHDEELLRDALAIIRDRVRTKRILVKTHLRDFDRQNKGHISRTQFLRCLKVLELSFPDNIMQLLLWKYASVNHPLDVHWKSFAAEVDPDPIGASAGEGSFAADAAADAARDAAAGKTASGNSKTLIEIPATPLRVGTAADELQALMERIQSKYARRRTDILAVFQQFDPLRSGRIARNRFRASLNAANLINLTDGEFALLADAYSSANKAPAAATAANKPAAAGANDPNMIEYVTFCHALESVLTESKLHLNPQAAPKSFRPVNEGYEDVSARGQGVALNIGEQQLAALTDPLIRLMRDTIYTRRIHPKQFFTQHDRHKTGCVTVGKFEAIIKGSLGFQIGAVDWANLVNRFRRDATHIRYVELCERLNEEPPTSTANRDAAGFSDDIEREKLKLAAMVRNPDNSPRSQPLVAHSLKAKSSTFVGGNAGGGVGTVASTTPIASDSDVNVETILAQLRTVFGKRRMDISDLFNDFDRLRYGRLPIATFRRAMDGAGLSLSEIEAKVLLERFASPFAANWIDYTAFLAALDLPTHLTGNVLSKSQSLLSPKGGKSSGKGAGAPTDYDQKSASPPSQQQQQAQQYAFRPSPRAAAAAAAALADNKDALGLTYGGNKSATQLATANKAAIAHGMMNDEERQRLNDLLHLLGVQIHTRGTLLKPHFQDYDRSRCGRVNAGRFRAVLSLHPMNLTANDFALLIKRFELGGPGVSYTAFLQEIERVESHFAQARMHTPRSRAHLSQPTFGAPADESFAAEAVSGAAAPAAGKGAGAPVASAYPVTGIYNKSDVMVIGGGGGDSARKENDRDGGQEKEQVLMPSITTNSSGSFDGRPITRDDLLHRLQTNVVQKRIVLRDQFQDFDPLRKGCVTQPQFRRVLKLRGVHVTDHELDVLCASYNNPKSAESGSVPQVMYAQFCNDLDLAITDPSLVTNPSKVLKPFAAHAVESVAGDLHRHSVRVATNNEKQDAIALVQRIALFVSAKRLFIKPSFHQHDKHHSGSVMRNRFGGVLKDAGISLNEVELDTIEKAYRKAGDRIDYVAFCEELYRGQQIHH